MKNTPNAVTRLGTITAWSSLAQPKSDIIMNSGMTPSSCGIAWVATTTTSSRPRPRKRSLAKAKPARVEKKTTETVIVPDTIRELPRASANSVWSKTLAMLSNRWPPGTSTGGTLPIASGVCEATTNDQ